MLKEISAEEFKDKVGERIKKQFSLEEQCYFAWLCAVRALPFLNSVRNFNCWEKDEIQAHLQSVFYVLDIIAAHSFFYGARFTSVFASIDTDATIRATEAYADARVTDDADAARTAADRAAKAIAYATATYEATTSHNPVTQAAATVRAVTTAKAAVAAASAAANEIAYSHIKDLTIRFQELILDDIELIGGKKHNEFQNDASIYGDLWENFQNDLTAIGCGYWGNLYSEIFANQFQFNKEDKEALMRRINVPSEVRISGASSVAHYLENAEKQGLVYIQRETRLIILGSAGAGKTTLVKRLNEDLDYPALKDSTHGVDTSVVLNCNGIKTRVWDFGGQVIYHSSHRCFMSENCIYILVVNVRTEDNRDINRIKYWLDTIRIYSDNKAKVFIILNESDNRKQNVEDYDTFKHGEYASLIQEIYSFNIGEEMTSVNIFKKDLAAYIEAIGHQTFGQNDSHVIEEINSLFEQNKKILEKGEMEAVLRRNGIKAKKDQRRARELFNILGIALSYNFMDSIVLDPYWISHGIYKIIDYLQKKKSCLIYYDNLNEVFADERDLYPQDKFEYIFKLIAHRRIGFRNEGGLHGLIIPCAASLFKPKDIIIHSEPDSIMTQVERDDLQEFPADFFYKFICSNDIDIKEKGEKCTVWQTGMVLARDHASALVELLENRRIEITVWGQRKEEYKNNLESLIDSMLKEYHFTATREERKRNGKLVTFIILALKIAKEVFM